MSRSRPVKEELLGQELVDRTICRPADLFGRCMELGSGADFRRHVGLSHGGTGKRERRRVELFGGTSGSTPSHGEEQA